jgi:ligand-binding sensor domain-containing protein
LWIGTWGLGLIRFNYNNYNTEHFHYDTKNKSGMQSNSIKTIIAEGSALWIGTLDAGLYKYDITKKVWVNYKYKAGNNLGISDNKIFALYKDRNENLWIGTFGGGLSLLLKEEQLKPANEAKFKNYKYFHGIRGLSHNIVTSLLQDRKGFLWIGTYGGGLDKLNLKKGAFTNYHFDPNDLTSLSKNDVLSIYEDASGTIWVGTHLGKGLSKIETSIEKFNRVVKMQKVKKS